MKKPRLSLYAQILLWFFLNLALVGVVLFLVLKVQFNVGLESLLSTRVGNRMVAVGEAMGAELQEARMDDWAKIVRRYERAYQVEFLVLRPNGEPITEGVGGEIPLRLKAMLEAEFRPPPASGLPPRRPGGMGPDRPDRPGPGRPRPGFERPPGPEIPPRGDERAVPHPRMLFYERAGHPPRYWAAVQISLANRDLLHPPDGIIVASAAELGGNGVFFDWRPWLWAVLGVLAVSALIWLPFVHRLTRRLRRLTAAAESISEGEFAVDVASDRGDELGRLSRAVQRMAQRLDEYVSGQKRFLGDIAHELCSPLVRVRMSLGILEQNLPPSEQGKLDALNEDVGELSQLVNELLDFSKASLKPQSLPQVEVGVADLLAEVARRENPDGGIAVEADPDLTMTTNPDLLRRALGNVVRNAVRYSGAESEIRMTARRDGGDIVLAVLDRGPGVPDEWLEKIFEPFARPERARTREGGGAGLGLAIARTCVEGLGGAIRGWNRRGGGFGAEFRFPDSTESSVLRQ